MPTEWQLVDGEWVTSALFVHLAGERCSRRPSASAADARGAREAERVVDLLERRDPPFGGEWDRWEPPAEWTVPRLPEGWDAR